MTSKDGNMPDDKLAGLLKRYEDGTCTEEERLLVEEWFEKYSTNKVHTSLNGEGKDAMFRNIMTELDGGRVPAKEAEHAGTRFSVRRLAVAASILLIAAAGSLVWYQQNKRNEAKNNIAVVTLHDVLPGGNKATLTLANGSVIGLTNIKTGAVVNQGSAKVTKVKDGELQYDASASPAADQSPALNTIATQLGGQYKVVLPDGSQVWLNSGSSLTFPERFTGPERNVTLTGEGYFEVAKNKAMPFKVMVNDVTVQVLGTHFNVMAYNNEPAVKTTLLEGSVKITTPHSSGLLKPNEMASVARATDDVKITPADIDKEVAWKNNLFWFDNASIRTVMNQLARWYDVDIRYQGNCTKLFTGTIPRNINASKVLKILEQTGGVHFAIDGKTITVLP